MKDIIYILLAIIVSFSVSFLAIPKIVLVSKEKKLFAVQNHRSAHKNRQIPNLGGIAIFSGIFISTVILLHAFDFNKIASILLASLVMLFMGLIDDNIGLSAYKKLTGQLLVGIYLIILGDVRFTNLHGIFGINEISYGLSIFISLIAIIGLTNAFNLIDGIDGLASGTGVIISCFYGILFMYYGQLEYTILSFSITGSLVAFFLYNVFGTKNKLFMGDTGSLTLGILFATLTILYNEIIPINALKNPVWISPAIALAIMILPVIDSSRVFYLRISQGLSPFTPDMKHIHHQLLKINKNHLHSSTIIILANLAFIGFTVALIELLEINSIFLLILTLGFLAAYVPVIIYRNQPIEEDTAKARTEAEDFKLYRYNPIIKLTNPANESNKSMAEVSTKSEISISATDEIRSN
jgi:UDP-N-acetylmuramyl pentapeptide phosphotransferase/UDP-N-acetylglucosamine-1-phosphate transferase